MNIIQIKEGRTILFVPNFKEYERKGTYVPSQAKVFYNPKMEFCRDIGVLFLREFSKIINQEIIICDPLAGVGSRGIRYANEVKGVKKSIVNDINKDAIPIIIQNIKINNLEGIVEVECKDANLLLIEYAKTKSRFNFIDLDPFGSPIPFITSAIKALKNHGVIAITATDTPALCGIYPKACLRKYGALSIKTDFCHEVGLRVLLSSLVYAAIKEDFGIEVLLSYSTDYYFRAYVQFHLGAKKADNSVSMLGYISYCKNCLWREVFSLYDKLKYTCPFCSKDTYIIGPIWCGPIIKKELVLSLIKEDLSDFNTRKRIEKLLNLLLDEYDMPIYYYLVDDIASKLKVSTPSVQIIIEKLKELGYKASRTHFNPKGIKSNAPYDIITNVIKKLGK
ncbi:MAG: tRNA (guanine(10)-N(2))-dimethyltransferase [Candidatus Verstraetearchaeota archaeon]|nr:tRNA (guanine(10)-N(2))-dimethyltransferase [Candidatus Verstraetearchaeota archaeon]